MLSPTLDLALTVARLGLATLHLDRKAADPDQPPAGEPNTFDLPNGRPIAERLKAFFRQQEREVLAKIPASATVPIPEDLSVTDWTDPMAHAMTPIITPYWEESGQKTMASLGLDPKSFEVVSPYLRGKIQDLTLAFCESTNQSTTDQLSVALDKLRSSLEEGIADRGETLTQLRDRVKDIFTEASDSRAAAIAETEASRSVNSASLESAKQSGVVRSKRLLLSSDACPLCFSVKSSEPDGGWPLDDAMYDDGKGHAFYSEAPCPPLHPRCCLPETPIVAPLGVAGIKAHYDGPIVRIHLLDGSNIAVTPNHMLLTPEGFARADSLMEDDNVLRYLHGESVGLGNPDDDREPTAIQEVVDSWPVSGRMPTVHVPVAPEYLHGDAAFCQGQIDVVTSYRFLRGHFDVEGANPLSERPLARTDRPVLDLLGDGEIATVLFALRDATDGGMGSLRELKAGLRARSAGSVQLALGSPSNRDPGLDETDANGTPRHAEGLGYGEFGFTGTIASDYIGIINVSPTAGRRLDARSLTRGSHDAGLAEMVVDGRYGDTDRLRDVVERFPGKVSSHQIIDVRFEHYAGPVYDVQTETSLYLIGNGIVSSNCQCTVIFDINEEALAAGDQEDDAA